MRAKTVVEMLLKIILRGVPLAALGRRLLSLLDCRGRLQVILINHVARGAWATSFIELQQSRHRAGTAGREVDAVCLRVSADTECEEDVRRQGG